MSHSTLIKALPLVMLSALGLAACEKPTVVNNVPPAPEPTTVPVPVPVPGPAGEPGPPGAPGPEGQPGAPGATGESGGNTVIVVPPEPAK